MPGASGEPGIFHLGWRANGDSFDVVLAVNRLLCAGVRAWWVASPDVHADAGDYLVEFTRAHQAALARQNIANTGAHSAKVVQ